MVLVTGPTGSGKTVSLYSCLNLLNKPGINISTAEDPAEINLPGVNQVNVNEKAGLTFPVALKAFLRQDPDIIMVGEIRDLATAEMAVQSALTGHLVFSTLHTNDAPSAITRLMELGVPSYLINAVMLGVLAQRLVRTLCPLCKQPDESVTREKLAAFVAPWQITGSVRAYRPVGCVDCRMTGYMGRMGLYELLSVSEDFKARVTKEPSLLALRRQAVTDGMRPLRLAGALRVAEGVTTIEEVLSATPPLE
jgi:general secretion pathway protein E